MKYFAKLVKGKTFFIYGIPFTVDMPRPVSEEIATDLKTRDNFSVEEVEDVKEVAPDAKVPVTPKTDSVEEKKAEAKPVAVKAPAVKVPDAKVPVTKPSIVK